MPFALIVIGLMLVVTGVRGTQSQLFTLVEGDFTGQDNFIYWALSILIIGAIGYIPQFKGLSRAFMGLVVVVLFLFTNKNASASGGGGFFQEFQSAISSSNPLINSGSNAVSTGTSSVTANIVDSTGVGQTLYNQSAAGISGVSTTLSDSGLPELPSI